MAIRALSRQEFDRFRSARATLALLTDRAVEWFADDTGVVLGAIAYDKSDLQWSFVVLGRDHDGEFRALDHDAGLRVLDDARRLLLERMASGVADRQPDLLTVTGRTKG